jgi:hypothetical protein
LSDFTPEQLRAYFDGRGDTATNRAISEALGDTSTRLGRWLARLQTRMRERAPRLTHLSRQGGRATESPSEPPSLGSLVEPSTRRAAMESPSSHCFPSLPFPASMLGDSPPAEPSKSLLVLNDVSVEAGDCQWKRGDASLAGSPARITAEWSNETRTLQIGLGGFLIANRRFTAEVTWRDATSRERAPKQLVTQLGAVATMPADDGQPPRPGDRLHIHYMSRPDDQGEGWDVELNVPFA